MCSVLYCERRVVGIETGYKKEPDVQHLQSLKFLVSCCWWSLVCGVISAFSCHKMFQIFRCRFIQ